MSPISRAWSSLVSRRALTSLPWWDKGGDNPGGWTSVSGAKVSEKSAFKYSVAFAAMNLIADSVASLPATAFTEDDSGVITPVQVPTWIKRPHRSLKRFEVFHQLMLGALAWGNGYARYLRRPSDGVVIGIDVLDPSTVYCEWDSTRPGFRHYRIGSSQLWLNEQDVLHIMGPALPGAPAGMSVISQAREAIGLGLTLEEFGATYFSHGSMAKTVIEMPGTSTFKEEQARQVVATYEKYHKGKGNWWRPAVISGGAKLHNISIPPEDAQFLESREFQAIDVARWFRVPPHRVGIISKQSSWGSGLAEENTALVQNTYRPWILRFEEALTAETPGGEGRGVQIRLKDDALLRGTFGEQVTAVGAAVEKKLLTPNEGRQILGYGPLPDGDKLVSYTDRPGAARVGDRPPPEDDSATAKEIDRKRKQDESGRSFSEASEAAGAAEYRADFSQVIRRIVRDGDNCPACLANEDPAKVPVHPRCNCAVETSSVGTGVDPEMVQPAETWLREGGTLRFVAGHGSDAAPPVAANLELDASSAAVLPGDDFRFADLLAWLDTVRPAMGDGHFITVTVDDTEDIIRQRIWLTLAREVAR